MAHRRRAKRRRPQHRLAPVGASPSELYLPADARPTILKSLQYGPDQLVEDQQPRSTTLPVSWIDVEGLGDMAVLRRLSEEFKLHRLVMEDIVNAEQRPKVERFDDQLYLVAKGIRYGEQLEIEHINIVLGNGYVLTVQEGKPWDCLEPVRERIRKKIGRIRSAGCDYLVYAILDALIDSFFPALEAIGEQLDDLEDEIFSEVRSNPLGRIHQLKRDLLQLRRIIWPLREMLSSLLRDESDLMQTETRLHLRDCYDHAVQVLDLIETYRELGSDLSDMHLSTVSNRTNEIMRVLTIISVLFMPLSFIAGLYGMNFDTQASKWNMPELNWPLGYAWALGLMATVSIGQLIFFWRRGWLGKPKDVIRVESGSSAASTA